MESGEQRLVDKRDGKNNEKKETRRLDGWTDGYQEKENDR